MGGFEVASHFKKIVFSKGWLCISLLCSINICFITFTAGYRYVVTKRQYPLLGSADYVEGKFTRVRDLEIIWHPIHVNLKWVPPIQPSLENYLENFKTQLEEIILYKTKKKKSCQRYINSHHDKTEKIEETKVQLSNIVYYRTSQSTDRKKHSGKR